MKKFESFILESCGFTVLLALISYAVVAMTNIPDKQLSILKFLAILGYGMVIAGARALYRYLPFNKAVRITMHYSMLLVGFLVLYLAGGKARGITPARVFIAIVLFTLLYTILMLSISGIRRLIKRFEKPTEAQSVSNSKKNGGKPMQKKTAYKPRFGSDSK